MQILSSSPAALLYLVALGLTVLGRFWKKGLALAYFGGLFWALGTLAALIAGAPLPEILAVTLLLLSASAFRRGGAAR